MLFLRYSGLRQAEVMSVASIQVANAVAMILDGSRSSPAGEIPTKKKYALLPSEFRLFCEGIWSYGNAS